MISSEPSNPISHMCQALNFFSPLPRTAPFKDLEFADPSIKSPPSYSFRNNSQTSNLKSFHRDDDQPGMELSRLNGPAFVGQVFSMCDLSGTGLIAISKHFKIPFIPKGTPGWIKKVFEPIIKSERNGPVFRFFMDVGDAVSYVKRLNIPSGMVGACRLDLAYEHFKEKPHLFQFVPNEKQVDAANKILKAIPGNARKIDGVPVFTAENLDIAIATTNGIKWYTPYFFDKNALDNILEESVDQHFLGLIQNRRKQRLHDAIDMGPEMAEETRDRIWETPEIEEVIDEISSPGIILSVISKAAEMELRYAVDKTLLGNRWLRKATGIQPKFPYMVDSFEKRSAASFLKASESTRYLTNSETTRDISKDSSQAKHIEKMGFKFPSIGWLNFPWSKECVQQESQLNYLLPKVTMVGISTNEGGKMSRSKLKSAMEDLTKQLERTESENSTPDKKLKSDDRDPLFVGNVGHAKKWFV